MVGEKLAGVTIVHCSPTLAQKRMGPNFGSGLDSENRGGAGRARLGEGLAMLKIKNQFDINLLQHVRHAILNGIDVLAHATR